MEKLRKQNIKLLINAIRKNTTDKKRIFVVVRGKLKLTPNARNKVAAQKTNPPTDNKILLSNL